MKKIKLFGDLQKFESDWLLDVQTPGEAFRAIEANIPGFLAASDAGHYGAVLVNTEIPNDYRIITQDGGSDAWGDEVLYVTPVASGELPAIPFLVATLVEAGMSAAAATMVAGVITNIVVSIAISAIANVITGNKNKTNPNATEKNKASFISNGPVNVTNEGHPFPIGCGEFLCGSIVLSSNIHIKNIPIPR